MPSSMKQSSYHKIKHKGPVIESPFFYFHDAVLRAPTIGCMLMCFASALVGVIVFLRKQSLLGEALSHAAYPGVIVGVICAGFFELGNEQETTIALLVMIGAFISAVVGLRVIMFLSRRLKVSADASLCFVLSSFFGIGLTLASRVQYSHSSLYRQAQIYLYGQVATMTDLHIIIYGCLSAAIVIVIVVFYKEIQTIAFDRSYAMSVGINTKIVDAIVFVLIVLAVVIGIRSVGVVLMSAMLIAPAATARQYTNKLGTMFCLASFFGILSGFLGNYLSVELSKLWASDFPNNRMALPTGPMIVIIASAMCVISLLLAPKRGLLVRLIRIGRFRYHCMCENLLKAIWRLGDNRDIPFDEIAKYQSASTWYLWFILHRLIHQGWMLKTHDGYRLTVDGSIWAARIVRLHRLWEVYLVDYVGVGVERVHRSAEEMEHIITPELEKQLTLLLKDPQHDPHDQPIPRGYSL